MNGLSLSSPSSRQSGYLGICCLIRRAGAKLSCGAEAAWRVERAFGKMGHTKVEVLLGGSLRLKSERWKSEAGGSRGEGTIAVMMSVTFIPTWVMSEARCSFRQSAAASSNSVEEWWRALLTWEKS